jgi:hypothetical protein
MSTDMADGEPPAATGCSQYLQDLPARYVTFSNLCRYSARLLQTSSESVHVLQGRASLSSTGLQRGATPCQLHMHPRYSCSRWDISYVLDAQASSSVLAPAGPTLQGILMGILWFDCPCHQPLIIAQLCAANQIIATDTYLPLFKCWNKDQSAAGKKGAAGGARKSDGSNKRTAAAATAAAAAAAGDQDTANKRRASGPGEGTSSTADCNVNGASQHRCSIYRPQQHCSESDLRASEAAAAAAQPASKVLCNGTAERAAYMVLRSADEPLPWPQCCSAVCSTVCRGPLCSAQLCCAQYTQHTAYISLPASLFPPPPLSAPAPAVRPAAPSAVVVRPSRQCNAPHT